VSGRLLWAVVRPNGAGSGLRWHPHRRVPWHARQREVSECPCFVVYDLWDDKIAALRSYMPMELFFPTLAQLTTPVIWPCGVAISPGAALKWSRSERDGRGTWHSAESPEPTPRRACPGPPNWPRAPTASSGTITSPPTGCTAGVGRGGELARAPPRRQGRTARECAPGVSGQAAPSSLWRHEPGRGAVLTTRARLFVVIPPFFAVSY
jgi:hypothetical protein